MRLAIGSGSLSESMSKLMQSIFLICFVFYLMGDGYNTMVVGLIDGLCNKLASLALPQGASLQDGFINFSSSQWNVISAIWSTYDQQGWFQMLQGIGVILILTLVLQVLFIIFALIAVIGYMSVLVTVGIGLSIGPLFIPFLVLDKTSFLFDGWVRFMIGASFTKVILAIIISVGIFAFKSIGTGTNVLGMMIVSTAFGGMLAFQLLRAPEIAQAILSGNAVSFSRFASRAGNAMSKTTSMLSKAMPKPPIPPGGGGAAGKAVSLAKKR